MSRTRTDAHAPSSPDFDPEAYDCRGVFDTCTDPLKGGGPQHQRIALVNQLVEKGYTFGPGSSHQCGHCGAHIRYCALMVREDIKQFIYVGETCLGGRFELTKGEFDRLRKAAQLNREKQHLLHTFRQLCERYPALAYATYSENVQFGLEHEARQLGLDRPGRFGEDHIFASGLSWGFNTVWDIARKARRYGSVSERQAQLIERIVAEQEPKWQAYLAKLTEKAANPAGPAPTGRQAIEGTVLSVKVKETDFGDVLKVTVKLDNGSRVYGTLPAAVSQAEKGDRIAFTASFSASDEPDFAWFSRPTKATFLVAAAA